MTAKAKYELVDKNGAVTAGWYQSAQQAAAAGHILWPDQPEDPDETGVGWRVRTVDGDFVHQRSDRGPVDIR